MERAALDFVTNIVPLFVLIVLGTWLVSTFSTIGVAAGLLSGNLAVIVAKLLAYYLMMRSNSPSSHP